MAKRKYKIAHIDGDIIKHTMASACEQRHIVVTNKQNGASMIFDTRTDFWGRGGNGGWLEEINERRDKQDLCPVPKEVFTFRDVQEAEPIENCLSSVKKNIQATCRKVGVKEYKVYLGEGECHRHKILLPGPSEKFPADKFPRGRRYKGNRDLKLKAIHVQAVHEYLMKHQNGVLVTGMEADDMLAILAHEDWKSGKNQEVIVTTDKDQMGCNGTTFNVNWMKEPMLIDGIGDIWVHKFKSGKKKDKIVGTGRKWLAMQILDGDTADHYWGKKHPCNEKTKLYGAKTVMKDLNVCETDREIWELIVCKYKEWLPEPVTYEAWDGSTVYEDWISWLQKHLTLAHMWRWEGDTPSVVHILENLGVEY